ncbi:Bifunctional folate synthesis protein [compost metagenome]
MSSDERNLETEAYIALGSNIDDRELYLLEAIAELKKHKQIQVIASSSIYETEPVGYVDQGSFLNMVIAITTSLSPHELLQTMQSIELQCGRTREIRFGPRTLDLDMLLYGQQSMATSDLIIPHPRMQERAFVLIPLAEVLHRQQSPSAEFILAQLEKLEGKEGVILWKKVQ